MVQQIAKSNIYADLLNDAEWILKPPN